MCLFKLFTSGTEVASSYANLSEQEKESTSEKSSTPTGWAWLTTMARHTVLEHQYGRSNVM